VKAFYAATVINITVKKRFVPVAILVYSEDAGVQDAVDRQTWILGEHDEKSSVSVFVGFGRIIARLANTERRPSHPGDLAGCAAAFLRSGLPRGATEPVEYTT
jgi:hypothetical protein